MDALESAVEVVKVTIMDVVAVTVVIEIASGVEVETVVGSPDELEVMDTGAIWYTFSLYDPPHVSDASPLHFMLQPVLPSGAGPPPLRKALSQSNRR